MARTEFSPTKEQRNTVHAMVMAGIQREIICDCIVNHQTGKPIVMKTLLKHFKEELRKGDVEANSKVVAALFRAAVGAPSGPQVSAAIFWAKTKLGWREPPSRHMVATKRVEDMNEEELVAFLGEDAT